MRLGSQFVELKISEETVKVDFGLETDVFNHEDESSEDQDFTTKTSENDKKNSTEDSEDEKTLLIKLNHALGELQSEDKAEASKERSKGRKSMKV